MGGCPAYCCNATKSTVCSHTAGKLSWQCVMPRYATRVRLLFLRRHPGGERLELCLYLLERALHTVRVLFAVHVCHVDLLAQVVRDRLERVVSPRELGLDKALDEGAAVLGRGVGGG